MITRLTFGVSAVLALFVISSVAGAVVWSTPVRLEPNVNIAATTAKFAAGQMIVAWEGNTGVWTALSRPGAGFSEQRLSRANIGNVDSTLLVVDSRGDAVVAWETRLLPSPTGHGLPPGALYVAYRPAGGRFGRPHRIARNTEGADIGIDTRGVVTVVWGQAARRHRPGGIYTVERQTNGRYVRARRVVRGSVLAFSLAFDGRGDAALIWKSGSLASPALLCATQRPGMRFGHAFSLVSARQGAGPFDVGMNSAGQATVAWEGPFAGPSAGTPYRGVETSTVDVGAHRPGRIQRLRSRGGGQLGDDGVEVAVSPRHGAAVLWDTVGPAGNSRIEVARRRAGRRFAAARQVGTGDIGGGFDAAIGPTGALAVAWERNYEIKAALAPGPQQPLGRPTTISPLQDGAAEPTVAVSSRGQGLALWQDLGPNHPRTGASYNSPLLLATTRLGR